MKRKPPIAKSLIKSSKAAIMAAIEIHNKPQILYRYEIVVLLVINAWELTLKAYIYKNLKSVRLFNSDGTTKPFPECVACVFSNLGNEYSAFNENIDSLYEFRNKIAHFYEGILDPIMFMLVKKSILFYSQFIKKFFNIDLSKESSLYLLPIGFAPLYSPVDYLSKHSDSSKHPEIVKAFLDKIIQTSKKLYEDGIDESILADFNLSLNNVTRIKNADIIVGLSSEVNKDSRTITIDKKIQPTFSNNESLTKIQITRDKSASSGVIMHEELSEGLFKEINNIIEANRLLSPTEDQFHLGEEVYYRIYAEREHVDNKDMVNKLMAHTALNKFYSPGLYWFLNLDTNICASLILDFVESLKSPNVHTFMRLIFLLGENAISWFDKLLTDKWKNHPQPPNYFWAFRDMCKNKSVKERRLLALRMTANQRLELIGGHKNIEIGKLLNDTELASSYLSQTCMEIFKGNKDGKGIARILDIIVYGEAIEEKADKIVKEIAF